MYRLLKSCRACGYGKTGPDGIKSAASTEKLIPVADFGVRPLANDMRRDHEERAGFAPLQVLFCPRCHLAQLSVVVNPAILYKDYPYVTSNTIIMHEHFQKVLMQIHTHLGNIPKSVLEIGSNDGRFLKFFQDNGVHFVMGVEPDQKLSETACHNGVPTTCAFWPDYEDEPKYDVIMARHVFAHVDDWLGFVSKASQLMHEDSILWIEAPYVQALLDQVQVDTIYHEHLSYVNLTAIAWLLSSTDLVLNAVERYDLHGGCVGLVIRKRGKYQPIAIEDENLTVQRWQACIEKASELIKNLELMVDALAGQGKTVCGYGASAKSSFWIHSCKFTRRELRFICDDTKQKWFRTSPGTDIPIVDEGALLRELPDFAVNFAWNFNAEVLRRQEFYIKKGGKFIVPVPVVKILP